MAHPYVVRSKSDKTGEKEKIRFYGTPVTNGNISTCKLAEHISDRCSLTRGDVIAAVSAIEESLLYYLGQGYTVSLNGIGSFSLSAGSEGFEHPADCKPHCVKVRRMCFKMSPYFRKKLRYIKFERK